MNINRKISKYNFNKGSVSRIKYIVIHYVGAHWAAQRTTADIMAAAIEMRRRITL